MHHSTKPFFRRAVLPFYRFVIGVLALVALVARAELRFDVFIGYDGVVRESAWFPITCEIENTGAPFKGFIEVSPANFGSGQIQRFPIELPTGTVKRVIIPTFAISRYITPWDIQLLDSRGKVVADSLGLRPQRQVGWETKLMGSLPRTAAGAVTLRTPKRDQPEEAKPAAARFQPSMFPDNPLVLESLDAIYLNSETAVSLRSSQVNALLAWMNAGGHLIVAIEQISDVTALPWLRNVLPVEPQDIVPVLDHSPLERWLHQVSLVTNYPPNSINKTKNKPQPPMSDLNAADAFGDPQADRVFEAAEIRVVTGKNRDGRAIVSAGDKPLMLTADRGLGRITTLMFSPEREPFKSWKDLPSLWTILLEVPLELYVADDFNTGYGSGVDGIFGAMIDSRQVHKLPIGWLLLLLLIYLLVIGPVDRIWLKRINRPMLTWITFPCYVVFFSGLIYFIGYRLRAGDSEYSELHVVDVLPNGERAELRGRTYASIYAPVNATYPMQSAQKFATFRGEYLASRGESAQKATVLHVGDTFKAEAQVPVWTSQLFVSDWWKPSDPPLIVSMQARSGAVELTVKNRSGDRITNARLAWNGLLYELGEIASSETRSFALREASSSSLETFVNNFAHRYLDTAQQRQYAFGRHSSGQIDDLPVASVVASLLGQMDGPQNGQHAVLPPGLDVSHAVSDQRAVFFGWSPGAAPAPLLNQSKAKRTTVNTLWRVPVAVQR